jgi:hypothetical protein
MTDTGCQIKRDDKHFSKKVEQAKKNENGSERWGWPFRGRNRRGRSLEENRRRWLHFSVRERIG